jgi:hypothetical protein
MNDEAALKIGDLVTRDGSDVHRVEWIGDDGLYANMLCVKAPDSGWIEEGEHEYNKCSRYSRIDRGDGQ